VARDVYRRARQSIIPRLIINIILIILILIPILILIIIILIILLNIPISRSRAGSQCRLLNYRRQVTSVHTFACALFWGD